MTQLTCIEKDNHVWICCNSRVILYVSPDGTLHSPCNIIAYSKIPPLPEEC